VRQDFDEVGRRCLAALFDILEGQRDPLSPSHPRVEPTLVVRRSSGPPSHV
jgi:LacI family transcriptional regulator